MPTTARTEQTITDGSVTSPFDKTAVPPFSEQELQLLAQKIYDLLRHELRIERERLVT